MKTIATLVGLTLVALVGGCASGEHSPVATAGQGEVIIICQLKTDGTASAVVPAANDLSKVPGVIDVSAAESHRARGVSNTVIVQTGEPERVIFVATLKGAVTPGHPSPDWTKALEAGGYMDKISQVAVYEGTLQNYLVSESFTQETTAADLQRRPTAIKQQNELRGQTK